MAATRSADKCSCRFDEAKLTYRDLHIDRGRSYDESLSSSAFDRYMSDWEVKHIRQIVKCEFGNGIGRYLDFACGTGRITQVIAGYAAEVVGIDISKTMLEVARAKLPNARFVEADLTSKPPSIGRFDLVSCFRFFGNAEPALRMDALRAINSVVKERGHLLVNNHRNPLALLSLIDRVRGGPMEVDLTYRYFRRILRATGFEIVLARPIAVWQFRNAIAARAGSSPKREAYLERLFSSGYWAQIAPDAVILAQKVRSPA